MRKKYDFILKFLLQTFTEDYLKHLLGLDLSQKPEFLDNELKFQTRYADAVLKLNNTLIHIEFQTKYSENLPKRMLEYAVRLESRYNLPVSSYLIILTKPINKYLPIPYKYEWKNEKGEITLSFRYKVINIWDLKREEWEKYNGLIPLLPLMKGKETIDEYMPKYKEKIQNLDATKEEKSDIATCLALINSVYLNIEELKKIWRDIMIASPLYKEILKEGKIEGLSEGMAKGLSKGLSEGKAEGKAEGLQESILTMVELEFKTVPKSIKTKIQKIFSIDKLRAILRSFKSISSLKDFEKVIE